MFQPKGKGFKQVKQMMLESAIFAVNPNRQKIITTEKHRRARFCFSTIGTVSTFAFIFGVVLRAIWVDFVPAILRHDVGNLGAWQPLRTLPFLTALLFLAVGIASLIKIMELVDGEYFSIHNEYRDFAEMLEITVEDMYSKGLKEIRAIAHEVLFNQARRIIELEAGIKDAKHH